MLIFWKSGGNHLKQKTALFYILISLIFLFPAKAAASNSQIKLDYIKTEQIASGTWGQRNVIYQNNDFYWMRTIKFSKTFIVPYVMNFKIPGNQLTIKYVQNSNKQKVWRTIKEPRTLPRTTCFLQTDKLYMILSMANLYKQGAHNTIEIKDREIIPLNIVKQKDGYVLTVSFKQLTGLQGEFWALQSSSPLINWANPVMGKIWAAYDLNEERKWISTGFYIKTPYNYRPTGSAVFWQCPSDFVASCFVLTGGSIAADELGWVMLNTSLKSQNKLGYWESGPLCEWLLKDYGIGYNYFDTRFNTDLALSLLKGYQKYDDSDFLNAAKKYADWLTKYTENNHYSVADNSLEGWLVEDYWCKDNHSRTHVSLNHQLQQINFLYEMKLVTDEDVYKVIADKMLYAIKITRSHWAKSNGDLYYCISGSGVMSKNDYPYLTYNDLFYTQKLLQLINNQSDPDIQFLMDQKKSWMEQNHIFDYRKI